MDVRAYPLSASHDLYRTDDRYCVGACHHQAMQGIEARRTAGKIANGYQRGCVSVRDAVGILYSRPLKLAILFDNQYISDNIPC